MKPSSEDYLDNSGRDDALSGGVRMIPVTTPSGPFRVWTRRFGNNPATKLLLLHGGPGASHEYLLGFDSYLPAAGVEYYYYDQLAPRTATNPRTRASGRSTVSSTRSSKCVKRSASAPTTSTC